MLHVEKLARKRVRNAPALAWHEFAHLSKTFATIIDLKLY